ncbi:glycine zipper 2TM domain-containing protein [Sphingomonas aestuarii]
MLNKLTLVGAAFAMGATALAVPAAPAQAASFTAVSSAASYYGYDQRYRSDRRYNNRNYRNDRRYYNNNQRCKDGDGGTVIGAVAGGLLGNQVAGRGDRLVGTVLGAGVGALAGRAIDRSDPPQGCRRSR